MKPNVKQVVLTGLFAALICVITVFPHFPIGVQGGYIHIGDTLIYIAASILPLPLAMLAASIGAGFADLFAGAVLYIIPTVIIKALIAACFTNKGKMFCKRNIIAVFLAAFIGIAGYYIAEVIMLSGDFITPLAAVGLGLIQPIASGILYLIIAKTVGDKLKQNI